MASWRPPTALVDMAMALIQASSTFTDLLRVHAFLLKASLQSNNFVIARFLRGCFSCRHRSVEALLHGRALFDRLRAPDTFLWNVIMRAYLQSGRPDECLVIYGRMRSRAAANGAAAAAPDSFTLSLALQACGRSFQSASGEAIHAHVFKMGFVADVFVQTALLEMYAKVGAIGLSRSVFDEMLVRDTVFCNVMLAEYMNRGDVEQARNVFDEIPERDLVSWNTMIYGYAKRGDLGAARDLFDRMGHKDLVSWSSMISAYAQSRQSNEALKLFREMQLANVAPDEVTMASVLSACADLGALGMGKAMHKLIGRNRIDVDLKLGTSLVDMYAKCGDIENSLKVFRDMDEKDSLTWSSMIIGLANHGLGKLALDFFSEMISGGIKPNEICFVGLLSACTHAGLVNEGWAHFNSMRSLYSVSPTIEHYGCMVDLLGRAGDLKEARKLIESMPFKADAVIWRTLLSACRLHKNVELAEEAMSNLVQLDPYADGNYVLLSNIYTQAKQWTGVANMRRMMKNKNIMKVPGSSSIEIDNIVYEFVAGDNSHSRCKEIYQMLGEMIRRIEKFGYVPVTSLISQDIDESAKESILAQHSEKLAIALGLLSLPPKSTILIVKNLRTCEDCHLAIKIVSLAYTRRIILRDRNRFHHFAHGECSCKDYW